MSRHSVQVLLPPNSRKHMRNNVVQHLLRNSVAQQEFRMWTEMLHNNLPVVMQQCFHEIGPTQPKNMQQCFVNPVLW